MCIQCIFSRPCLLSTPTTDRTRLCLAMLPMPRQLAVLRDQGRATRLDSGGHFYSAETPSVLYYLSIILSLSLSPSLPQAITVQQHRCSERQSLHWPGHSGTRSSQGAGHCQAVRVPDQQYRESFF